MLTLGVIGMFLNHLGPTYPFFTLIYYEFSFGSISKFLPIQSQKFTHCNSYQKVCFEALYHNR